MVNYKVEISEERTEEGERAICKIYFILIAYRFHTKISAREIIHVHLHKRFQINLQGK